MVGCGTLRCGAYGRNGICMSRPQSNASQLQLPFLWYERNRAFVQGTSSCFVIRPRTDIIRMVTGALFAIYFLIILTIINVEAWVFYSRSVATEGMIVALWIEDDERHVQYSYTAPTPDGSQMEYIGEWPVDSFRYTRLSVGHTIAVRYTVDNPTQSRVAWEPYYFTLAGMTWTVIAFVLGRITILSTIVCPQRYQRFKQHGQLLRGEVDDCWSSEDDDGFVVTLTYRFISPNRRRIKAYVTRSRYDLKHTTLPTPADIVYVLYVSDNEYVLL